MQICAKKKEDNVTSITNIPMMTISSGNYDDYDYKNHYDDDSDIDDEDITKAFDVPLD